MLNESDKVLPYGLILSSSTQIELILPVDVSDNLGDTLNIIQDEMKAKVLNKECLASSIVYSNYEAQKIEAYLENVENYCLKINIPVVASSSEIKLIPENIETEDGGIYVFPIVGESI